LRLTQIRLEALALGDVEADAGGPHRDAVLVVERAADLVDRMYSAVRPDGPIDDVPVTALADPFVDRIADQLSIVRVHVLEEAVDGRRKHAALDAVERLQPLRPSADAARQVHLPRPDAGRVECEPHLLFRVAQR